MWLHENKEFSDCTGYYGFVYLITNTVNNKKYIGRKYFTKAGTKQVKGKRKKTRKTSDWLDYYGSSPRLLEDIKQYGKECFKRDILRLCRTRGECNYWEVKLQFEHKVLESDQYYNDNIAVKFTRRNIGSVTT